VDGLSRGPLEIDAEDQACRVEHARLNADSRPSQAVGFEQQCRRIEPVTDWRPLPPRLHPQEARARVQTFVLKGLRLYQNPSAAHFAKQRCYFVGTRSFSSSIQFSTTLRPRGANSSALGFSIKKRPSGARS
jgi:hypothetical protein